jgi:hypothetical protein
MTTKRLTRDMPRFLACLLLLALAITPAAPAREVVPAPPGGGPGQTVFAPDNGPLGVPGSLPALPPDADPAAIQPLAGGAKFPLDTIGGDDVLVLEHEEAGDVSMDIASNGDIYVAVQRWQGGSVGSLIVVYRSSDHGNTFQLWGTLQGGELHFYVDPHLKVVEGSVSGCYILFSARGGGTDADVWLVRSPLGGSSASFDAPVIALSQPGINFYDPRFDTDVSSFSQFYVYVVAQGNELGGATGADIWFARSIDQGASFESGYMLATLAVPDRHYFRPDIAYGYGGHLHACWFFESSDGSFDGSVRYRHASGYAGGGLSSWDNWVAMTSTSDGFHDQYPRIEAGHASDAVVLGYRRMTTDWIYQDTTLRISYDSGATWTHSTSLDPGPMSWGQIIEDPATNTWYMMGLNGGHPCLWTTHASQLTSWSNWEGFADQVYPIYLLYMSDLALNPAKDNRPAVAWTAATSTGARSVKFDAEWRGDPGYPNLEPGFPLGLWAPPRSAPALVDVDGDGDLEIVFADGLNMIQVIDHDGGSPPGWPVDVGTPLSNGPVAVGDLAGDGQMTLVAGTSDGRAYAYDRTGALLPGWPVTLTGGSYNVYVSIGALGGPYPRTVVACASNQVFFRSHHGTTPTGVPFWNLGVAHTFSAPAAIGDIDGDGVAEAVCGLGPYVAAFEMRGTAYELYMNLGSNLSDAVTLGDLDLDGDLEIICPTVDGILHVHHHTGAVVAGFPFNSGTTYNLTSGAIAQCLGTWEPEIAIGRQDWTVHLLYYNGTQANGYPQQTGTGWWLFGAPIIGRVDGTSADVVVGARDKKCWAWNNFGALIEGWPKDAGSYMRVSPAMGDLDLDGSVEVVFVADTQLLVVDINNTETEAFRTWPMYGHDPQRTGCSDCPEDVTTAVDDSDDGGGETITRVRFAPPSPNPVHGATTFTFAVPVQAVVSLDIYDLRGARIYTLYREETEPGHRTITWHGRGALGEPLPSGQYLARLRVRGPCVNESLTRKVTILR